MLLPELLNQNIETYGEYEFLYCEDRTYTNLQARQTANHIARLLRHVGVARDDRVMVCMPNNPEVIFSYQGISRAGAIIVPVMFLLHSNEIAFIAENAGVKAIVTSSLVLDKVEQAIQHLSKPPVILAVDVSTRPGIVNLYDPVPESIESNDTQRNGLELHRTNPDEAGIGVFVSGTGSFNESAQGPSEHDTAVILYTSGTTGRPKGVMLTHKNLYSNAHSSAYHSDPERGITLGVLPLAHVYGLTVSNACYITGSSIVVFPKFDTIKVFEAIQKYRVKRFSAVPAMIHAMTMHPDAGKYDLSSLESVGSGSAPLPMALRDGFRAKFGAEVYEGYGLSEAAPVVTAHRRGQPVKPGSVGIPIPGVEIRIVDETGQELPAGEIGELTVRGDNVTPGYFQNPEASRTVLRDSWLYTGDLARVDEDGYLYIVDRKKDLIIRGGFNIYPRDLEELLVRHEAVSEAAVVGVPSPRMGEEVVAYVVAAPGVDLAEQQLLDYCQDHLAKYKTPRKIAIVDALPRNGVGKILKTELRKLAQELKLDVI
ncbi:AMP-binding protein [Alicyclobacillus tolerans]|uniref:class I adenylate-forming enzyme family protein n=1 Tax=Alicyclobacillus tolerans TaxID=90970 RepID=UPI001F3095FD|nr:AMP-binding protein [Alicyclobacillus tolerans]MCF8565254.1 AMP-binding protein [Alicyclobacillus tolerans]